MAGDIPVDEHLVLLDEARAPRARAVEETDERDFEPPIHTYGRVAVFAGRRGEGTIERALHGEAAAMARVEAETMMSRLDGELSEVERYGVEATLLRQSPEYVGAKLRRPRDGEDWDMEGACAGAAEPGHGDGEPLGRAPGGAGSPAPAPFPGGTSDFLVGSIAVGVVIVSGPDDLAFTDAERTTVVAEVQNGLSFFATQNPAANLTFSYDVHHVVLTVPADTTPGTDLEALWRDPAMADLGFGAGHAGVRDYIRDLRTTLGTDWTYCAFFTKYPVNHFAYAFFGGPHLVMQYDNDGWGPDNIDRVFAHETGHIFNAPDEYAGSGCDCGGTWGRYDVPNRNCERCGGDVVPCLMRANTFALCPWTPRHIGWPGWTLAYQQGDPGSGVGGYDLRSGADRIFAFDFDEVGRNDHLALYRPGTGTLWILRNDVGRFVPVYQQGDPGSGVGGYDLRSAADRIFAFDYDHAGRQDHLALYRPGTGTFWILRHDGGTAFTPVYQQGDPGSGIGGYDLRSAADRAFAFDFDKSGRLDHVALYRPGTGTIWILRNAGGTFSPVYQQGDPGSGIGGYDLRSPADRVFAFDFDKSGRLDHLALYRPGTGTLWILRHDGGTTFTPVYQQGDPGSGVGGYDLRSPADRMFAVDYAHTGRLDHLALYRPGTGTFWVLRHDGGGSFTPVYQQGDPGAGVGGYDLRSGADRAFAFDYLESGRSDWVGLYRPGTGTLWVMSNYA